MDGFLLLRRMEGVGGAEGWSPSLYRKYEDRFAPISNTMLFTDKLELE